MALKVSKRGEVPPFIVMDVLERLLSDNVSAFRSLHFHFAGDANHFRSSGPFLYCAELTAAPLSQNPLLLMRLMSKSSCTLLLDYPMPAMQIKFHFYSSSTSASKIARLLCLRCNKFSLDTFHFFY